MTNCPRLFGLRYQDETRGHLGAEPVEANQPAGRHWFDLGEIVVVSEYLGDYLEYVENHFGGAGRRSLVVRILVRSGSRVEGSRKEFRDEVELLHRQQLLHDR